jgi:hypothetical protein
LYFFSLTCRFFCCCHTFSILAFLPKLLGDASVELL